MQRVLGALAGLAGLSFLGFFVFQFTRTNSMPANGAAPVIAAGLFLWLGLTLLFGKGESQAERERRWAVRLRERSNEGWDVVHARIPWGDPLSRVRDIATLGEVKAATRRSRLLTGGLGALAALLLVLAGEPLGPKFPIEGPARFVFVLFFLASSALVSYFVWKRSRDFVAVFEGGVAFFMNGSVRVAPWSEIDSLDQQVSDLVDGSTRRAHDSYTLRLRDGTEVAWNWEFERHRQVGQCCVESMESPD